MKSTIIVFFITQIVIFVSIWVFFDKLSLLNYINTSFFISFLTLFIGAVMYIIRTGFFDFFMQSTRKVLARKGQKEAIESMRPFSETLPASPAWFFLAGLPSFVLMLIALIIYYI
ncbi:MULTISPECIES: DUF3899 domain-containing protein [Sporosarcina]|uniref:DUF3899 domain-containing protein n=1 Tax=Sporosarcina TaxID=1569 RepID=UPI00129B015F|nr:MULTISPECIES: DUF3899 domain-containing protein [Sporosarcina]